MLACNENFKEKVKAIFSHTHQLLSIMKLATLLSTRLNLPCTFRGNIHFIIIQRKSYLIDITITSYATMLFVNITYKIQFQHRFNKHHDSLTTLCKLTICVPKQFPSTGHGLFSHGLRSGRQRFSSGHSTSWNTIGMRVIFLVKN